MSGSQQRQGFTIVDEPPKDDEATRAAMRFWLMSMQNLSNRAVAGLSALFTGAVVASAWALFMWTLPAPSTPQLIGLSVYCLFLLAVEWIRRKP